MTFMFLMLNAHKQGAVSLNKSSCRETMLTDCAVEVPVHRRQARSQQCEGSVCRFRREPLKDTNARCSESRYYKLKKTHWDTNGGSDLLQGGESAAAAVTPKKTPTKPKPKSKKRQLETDGDEEEAAPEAKSESSAKKQKGDDEDIEGDTKAEPGSDDNWA